MAEAILHVFDGLPRLGAPGATAIEPGACAWEIAGAEGFDFVHEQQMRSFENTAIYEVLTFDGYTERAQLAVLRHELEHVRQYRQSMYLLRASTAIRVGLTTTLCDHRTIAGSLYIAMPTERAADQAGRRLAVATFGADSGFQQARSRLVGGMEAARAIGEPSVVRETLRRLVLEAETAAGEVASVTAAAG